jgi:hypothetical protein
MHSPALAYLDKRDSKQITTKHENANCWSQSAVDVAHAAHIIPLPHHDNIAQCSRLTLAAQYPSEVLPFHGAAT